MAVVLEKSNYFYDVISIHLDLSEADEDRILNEFPVPDLPEGASAVEIANERHGAYVNDVLLLLSQYSVEFASNGNPYLKIVFANKQGAIPAKMWDNNGAVDNVLPLLEKYSLFTVGGKVEEFPRDSGKKSLTINRMEPFEAEDINPFSLLPCTKQSMKHFVLELYTYMNELDEPHRTIGLAGMKQFWQEFVIRPAAKGHHHNYLGGLLKHTVGLMRIARYLLDGTESFQRRMMRLIHTVENEHKKEVWTNFTAEIPLDPRKLVWNGTIDHLYSIFNGIVKLKGNEPNKDLLIASIFYHDIGKIMEYSHAGKGVSEFQFLFPTADTSSLSERKPSGITMDPLGALVGHMPYGVLMLSKVLEIHGISISIDDIHHYNHCILSHHGKHEWQSTVVPATVEAYLLHFVDFLDSRYETSEEIK